VESVDPFFLMWLAEDGYRKKWETIMDINLERRSSTLSPYTAMIEFKSIRVMKSAYMKHGYSVQCCFNE